jgi:hypothetical protein
MTTLNWRPHTEVPDPKYDDRAHLLAEQNSNGDWYLIPGLFYFISHKDEPRRWRREDNWKEYKPDAVFFWLPEYELLTTLPKAKK